MNQRGHRWHLRRLVRRSQNTLDRIVAAAENVEREAIADRENTEFYAQLWHRARMGGVR